MMTHKVLALLLPFVILRGVAAAEQTPPESIAQSAVSATPEAGSRMLGAQGIRAMEATSKEGAPLVVTPQQATPDLSWQSDWPEGSEEHRREMSDLEGKPAPPLKIAEWIQGDPVSLRDLKGYVVILGFWGSWSPKSLEQISEVARIALRYKDWNVIFVAVHPPERCVGIRDKIDSQAWHFPIGIDDERQTLRAYCVDTFPDFYLIGRSGRVLCADIKNERLGAVIEGILEGWLPPEVAASLPPEALEMERNVPEPTTPEMVTPEAPPRTPTRASWEEAREDEPKD